MKKLLSIVFALSLFAGVEAKSTLDSLMSTYYEEAGQAEVYRSVRQRRIDSLKNVHPLTRDTELRIAREYQHYQSDSSRAWYLKLINAPEPYRTHAYTGLVELATSIGKYADGMVLVPDVTDMPDSLHIDWLEAVWKLHVEAAASTAIPQLKTRWTEAAKVYYDSLLLVMDRHSAMSEDIRLRREILGASDSDDVKLALAINDTMLSHIAEWSHPYAIAAYNRAMMYEKLGRDRKRIEWLTRSSIADVRCGITDNGSSWLVAKECYESGDLERAYRFSDYSLTNASFFNAPTRFIQTYALGHEIGSSYENRLHRYYVRLIIALVFVVLATVCILLITLYAFRQNRRLNTLNREMQQINERINETNRQLKASNFVKEQYICRYLEVYSDYIRRLTTMARKAGEKDPAGFMDREMENFYRSFDDTFLSLYGTFVQDFNALLKPEARITPKPGERMTIEMRIFALILLGITSSAKIAELLCYSPNTISNYRVKMKNGALGDRDTFEQRVQQIGKE